MKRYLSLRTTLIVSLLGLGVAAFSAHAQTNGVPARPQGYVSDYAGILNPSTENKISTLASELDRKTSAQLAVVTVKTTYPETVEGYAVGLFEKWGIGQKGKDNGVLLLVASQDRRVRIEVGYGLEGVLTDAISRKVIESFIVPSFKAGQYSQGVLNGVTAIVSLVAKSYGVGVTGREAGVYETVHRQPSMAERIFHFIFTLFFLFLILSGRSGLLGWFLLGSMMGGHRRGGYWYGSGYGGSGGGFGGGFGGFGGGFSGGGGASGSW